MGVYLEIFSTEFKKEVFDSTIFFGTVRCCGLILYKVLYLVRLINQDIYMIIIKHHPVRFYRYNFLNIEFSMFYLCVIVNLFDKGTELDL